MKRAILSAAVCASLALAAPAHADEWAVSIFGLSYHPDRAAAHATRTDNEVNPGLGLRYTWDSGVFAEVAAYKDSGRNTARYAGAGYQWRFGALRAGGALVAMQSATYNGGRALVAPLPIVSVEVGRVLLNSVYMPKVKGLNEIGAVGFYVTVPLGGAR